MGRTVLSQPSRGEKREKESVTISGPVIQAGWPDRFACIDSIF